MPLALSEKKNEVIFCIASVMHDLNYINHHVWIMRQYVRRKKIFPFFVTYYDLNN